jgi:peptidoglycan/LPS O-acetylase OafA/YrhL
VKGFLGTAVSFGGSLTGLQVWIPSLAGLNFPSWTVATELCFYSIFPILLPRISRVQTTRAAARMAALCWLLFSLLPALFLLGFSLTSEHVTSFVERNPLFRVSEFIIGALVGRIYQIRRDTDEDENAIIAVGLFLISGIGIIFMAATHSASEFKILENALLVPFYAFLIIATAMSAKKARIMSHPLLVALGAASYALYLIHALIWEFFARFGLTGWPNAYLAYLAAAIGGSLLVHFTIEDVARRKIISASRTFHDWRAFPERRR